MGNIEIKSTDFCLSRFKFHLLFGNCDWIRRISRLIGYAIFSTVLRRLWIIANRQLDLYYMALCNHSRNSRCFVPCFANAFALPANKSLLLNSQQTKRNACRTETDEQQQGCCASDVLKFSFSHILSKTKYRLEKYQQSAIAIWSTAKTRLVNT